MEPDLERAETLMDLGRAAEAERVARDHLATHPESAAALNLLCRALNEQRRHREAEQAIRAALELEPDESAHVLQLASTQSQLGQQASAVHTALHLLDLEPYEWSSHYIHCQALLSGRRPRTRQAYDAAVESRRLAPWNPDTHNLVGMCAADLKRPDEAEAAYREALRLDPQHAYAMNNLAALALDRGEFGSAGAGLTTAAQTTPQEQVIRANLDLLLVKWAQRLLYVELGLGVLVGAELAAGAPWWLRALTGVVFLAAVVGSFRRLTDALPRGFTVGPGLLRRASWAPRRIVLLTCLCTVALVVMCFAPAPAAAAVGLAMLVLLQAIGFLVIVGYLLLGVVGLLRRGQEAHEWRRVHGRRRRGKQMRFR